MDSPESPKKFRWKIRHFFLIAIVGFVAIAAWVTHLETVANETFASFVPICDGKRISPTGENSMGKNGIVFERDDEQHWHVTLFKIPDEMTASRVEDVGFVTCLEPELKTAISGCSFQEGMGIRVIGINVANVGTGGVTTYPRVQHELPIRIIDPRSGVVLTEGVVLGKTPPGCSEYVGKVSEDSFDGASVDAATVGAWLIDHRIR